MARPSWPKTVSKTVIDKFLYASPEESKVKSFTLGWENSLGFVVLYIESPSCFPQKHVIMFYNFDNQHSFLQPIINYLWFSHSWCYGKKWRELKQNKHSSWILQKQTGFVEILLAEKKEFKQLCSFVRRRVKNSICSELVNFEIIRNLGPDTRRTKKKIGMFWIQ